MLFARVVIVILLDRLIGAHFVRICRRRAGQCKHFSGGVGACFLIHPFYVRRHTQIALPENLEIGPDFLQTLLVELATWLEAHEFSSVEQLKGSMSRRNCPDASALERANYMKALENYTSERPMP